MEPAAISRYDQVPQLQEADDASTGLSSSADLPPTISSDDHSTSASDGEVHVQLGASTSGSTCNSRHHTIEISTASAVHGETNHQHQEEEEEELEHLITVDEAIERLGMGPFQRYILVASGLCFASDAMQVVLLSFLTVVLQNDWNLSGEEAAAITSAIFLGAMMGTLVLGPLADMIGRRPVFLIAALEITIFGLGAAMAPNYLVILFMIFMVGVGVGGLTVPFDILAEFLPSTGRGTSLLLIEYFWTGGVLFVVLVAYTTLHSGKDEWRNFVALCSIPCLSSLVIGYFYVPESPRWLVAKNQPEKAMAILRKAATKNSLDVSMVFPEHISLAPEPEHEEASIIDLFKPEWRRTILLLWGTWFFFPIGYYGTIMLSTRVFEEKENSTGDSGDVKDSYDFDYSAIFVSSAAEIIGTTLVIYFIDRVGRIRSQVLSYAVAGVSNFFLCTFAASGSSPLILVCFDFLSRIFEMSGTCVTWVSTAEVLTTELRTTGHSTANAIARISAFMSPFLFEGKTSLGLIGLIMLVTHGVTMACVSQLPETTGREMGMSSERGYDAANHEEEDESLPVNRGHIL